MKNLPEKCITCNCHLTTMRSCRKYDCSEFPVHERVCAGIEFDMNVQRALARYETRLKSSCRAAREQMERKTAEASPCNNAAVPDETPSIQEEKSSFEVFSEDEEPGQGNTDKDGSFEPDDLD